MYIKYAKIYPKNESDSNFHNLYSNNEKFLNKPYYKSNRSYFQNINFENKNLPQKNNSKYSKIISILSITFITYLLIIIIL